MMMIYVNMHFIFRIIFFTATFPYLCRILSALFCLFFSLMLRADTINV